MAYSAPGSRRAGRIVGWLVALGVLGLLAALVATIVVWIGRWNPPIPAPVLPAEGCMVTVEGFTTTLTQEQSVNASIIVGESIRRGLPARAATIALVTAYQESDLRNLDYGDRDSIGLFQQRPSQGWGTVEQIMDPWYSAGQFYDHLVLVPGWESGVINDVAQAVQRSGHPDAYAQHEAKGRAWASALTGFSPATVTCVDRSGTAANAAALTDFMATVWGPNVVASPVELTLQVTTPDETVNWSVAHLSMLRGSIAGVTAVQVAEQSWTNAGEQYTTWQPATPAASPVLITLRG